MKIVIYSPKSCFTKSQQQALSECGTVIYTEDSKEMTPMDLKKLAKGADIIAPDPDNFGGFEKALPSLTQVMESLPHLKGVALSTTSFGWIDLDYCKKREIPVSNVPGYSRESVAEHALALLLCLAKQILITDRKTQKGEYKLSMGFELKGKILGVIGLGNIGSRVAELGKGIGMKVIAHNRSSKKMAGVEIVSLDKLLKTADAISFHTTHEPSNKEFIGKKEIGKLKKGIILVNTADRELLDEKAMAEALKSDQVFGYAYEGEDLEHSPLAGIENAIGIKGFGWYTKEALANLFQIWVDNIIAIAKDKPQNRVV